ncbi:hypothetical protein AVEN_1352-1 [Araneus ventricosus]|uniref:Uncharacterized protein n=1 Tax=Araneus ventricosus TaxID=182803 RepID=A0A4Y2D2U9_ARAVE|nr:hypothetical protein AVEN_1352-1 [Araneus ventricosus]
MYEKGRYANLERLKKPLVTALKSFFTTVEKKERALLMKLFDQNGAVDKSRPLSILWSDEAHLILDGVVNTQNCRIWDTANPNFVHKQSLHPDYVTVRCGFTADLILDLFLPVTAIFFRSKSIKSFKVRTRVFKTNVFKQDGEPHHIARLLQALFRTHFGDDRIISRSFPTVWPPRSPNLNPCVFWLWGIPERFCLWRKYTDFA